jgi:hypothetical protein
MLERREVPPAIIVIVEARQPVVPALHDVLRDTCKIGAGKSGHAGMFVPQLLRRHRQLPTDRVGIRSRLA